MLRLLCLVLLLSGLAQAQTSTVRELYDWYLKQKTTDDFSFAPVRDLFEPGLYAQLTRVWGYNKALPGQLFLDFDPVLGSQVGADKYAVDSEKVQGDVAYVVIRLTMGWRGGDYPQGVKLVRSGGRWLVADWYTPGKDPGNSSTRKIFDEIDYQATIARQAKRPDWAAKGLLDSYLKRKDWQSWWQVNRGRFNFDAQEALDKRSTEADPLLGGLTGALVVEKATITGDQAHVAATVGGKLLWVELVKEVQFDWRVTGVTRDP